MPANKYCVGALYVGLLALSCGGCGASKPIRTSVPDRGQCGDFELDVERFWSTETRGQLRAAVSSVGVGWSEEIAERVVTRMDQFTRSWVMMQEGICKDTLVRQTMPKEVYTKVSLCLRSSLIAQQTVASVLQSSPAKEAVFKADEAIIKIGDDARACQEQAIYSAYDDLEGDAAAAEARSGIAKASAYSAVGDRRAGAAAEVARTAAGRADSEQVKIDAILELGEEQLKRDAFAEAQFSGEEALRKAEAVAYGKGQASALDLIGWVYYGKGDSRRAHEFFTKAVAIFERVLGAEHPDTASGYDSISATYKEKGDYDRALQFLTKALFIREKVFGAEHPTTARSYNNFGVFYCECGDYDRALQFYTKALVIDEKAFGAEHPTTAVGYSNIGITYHLKGDYDRALEFHTKALFIREKVLGTECSETTISYFSLGQAYCSKGNYDRALEFYTKALVIRERVLGTEHPLTRKIIGTIGLCCLTARNQACDLWNSKHPEE